MKRCGCYIRVSTLSQKDNFSVEVQRKRANEFCEKNGYEAVLYDEQASASTLLREQFTRLLTDIEKHEIQAVWCIEFTRLTRDEADAIEIRRLFVKHEIQLFINGSETDLTSPESVLMFNINSAVASYERARVIERSLRGKKEWRDKGNLKYSIFYGYDNVYLPDGKKTVVINEEEAKGVRYMFELYASGLSLKKVCERLTTEGFPTKKGGYWVSSNVCRGLQKLEYVGLTTDSNGEIIKSQTYPAIVDMDLWKRVQSQKRKSVAGPVKNLKRGKFQLSNLMRCGKCGSGYYYNYTYSYRVKKGNVKIEVYGHYKKNKKSYTCDNRPKTVRKDFFEKLIGALYLETFNNSEEIQKYIEMERQDLMQQKVDIKESVDRLNKQLKDAEKRKSRLMDAVINGVFTQADAAEKSSELNEEISNLKSMLAEKTKNIRLKEDNLNELIEDFARTDTDEFFDMPDWEKRKIYIERIRSMTITDRILEVTFITGLTYILDIDNLPDWVRNGMEIVGTYLDAANDEVLTVTV
jgi:site-specific DNA recombinase